MIKNLKSGFIFKLIGDNFSVRNKTVKLIQGFTLTEIMISLSIVTVIMASVLFDYSTFNDNLALSSAGQEIAVTIRQAQTYGLNVRETGVSSGQFNSAYGIHFDVADPTHYYLFADNNSNNKYDAGSGCGVSGTECVSMETLRGNVRIFFICDAVNCPINASVKMVDITFLRPDTDAIIYFSDISGSIILGPHTSGRVILISPKGKYSAITVESTGQILVQ